MHKSASTDAEQLKAGLNEYATIDEPVSRRNAAERRSRRLVVALVALGTGWAAIAAIVSRILLALIDTLDLSPVRVDQVFMAMRINGVIAVAGCVLLLVVRRRHSLSARWPKVALVANLALFALSFDLIAGYCYPAPRRLSPIVVRHERRCFAHQPGKLGFIDGVTARTNRFGFRGARLPEHKDPASTRILFLGDSVTFGTQLSDDDTPVSAVQRFFNGKFPDRRVRCMNAGVCGYATWQQLDLLRDEGLAAAPDVVVLQFCLNDMIDVAGVERGVLIGNRVRFEPPASFHWSGTVRAVTTIVNRRRNRTLEQQQDWAADRLFAECHSAAIRDLEDVYRDPPLDVVREAWEKCFADLDAIARVCRENSIGFMIVYAPLVDEIRDGERYGQPARFLSEWAAGADVPYLDLTNVYGRIHAASPELLKTHFIDNLHVSDVGAQVMGEAIGRFIVDERILDLDAQQ